MGLRIQTNLQSLNSQKSLSIANAANDQAMERLSSGFRINKAADDAAGLAISEKLKADVRSLNMAKRNANDGISMIQVAEGGMNEIGNILSRLRELSVQGSSDTIGNQERGFINKEYMALKDEIQRITNSTEYNGTLLLVGERPEERIPDPDILMRTNTSPFEFQVGKSWYAGVDGAEAEDSFKRNPVNVIRVRFENIDTGLQSLGLGNTDDNSLESAGTFVEDSGSFNVFSEGGNSGGNSSESKLRSQQSINKLDKAISIIAGYRADLGAIQSRLNSTVSNLSTMSENYSAANSRIRDTDFAEETTKNMQTNILKQAGVAVLSQANQSPSAAIRLLSS